MPLFRPFIAVFYCCCLLFSLQQVWALPLEHPLSSNKPLAPDQAFILNSQQKQDDVIIEWDVYPGYFLYVAQISIIAKNAELMPYTLPIGEMRHDAIYGDTRVVSGAIKLDLKLKNIQPDAQLLVTYQGCASFGFCYPNITKTISLSAIEPGFSIPFSPLIALLLGVGITFTPCVLPLYPLLSAIIIGPSKTNSGKRVFALSFFYVQGMALAYTLLGLLVVSVGIQLQIFLQNPYVLTGMAVLFVALSLSMFGIYNLQLPTHWQTRLTRWSNQQKSGALFGVFVMGMLAGLISSPCTTAPLSAILLYIAQSGSFATGAITLYFYALGMGIPLILIALFGHRLLPKRGQWLNYVKQLFGFIILTLPILLLERVYGETAGLYLWALWGVSFLIWVITRRFNWPKRWLWGMRTLIFLLILSALYPLLHAILLPSSASYSQIAGLMFKKIESSADLQQALAESTGQIVMLDFYADWCVTCKQFEREVLADPKIQTLLADMVLLKLDATVSKPEIINLLNELNILGFPSILFFNRNGSELIAERINGFMDLEQFVQHLQRINQQAKP